MKTAFVIVACVSVPLSVAVFRISENTIDTAALLITGGLALLMGGGAAAIVIDAAGRYRAAQHPKPSHTVNLDRREQYIDARSIRLIDADGQQIPVELPAGAMMEVIQ